MLKIKLICVGKIKEEYFKKAIDEYVKRLKRYVQLSVIEVADEKTIENAPPAEEDKIRQIEGERILKHIKDTDYVCALAIEGKAMDSVALATYVSDLTVKGISSITFIIGGSLGLASTVLARSNQQLSFSKLTFPHQLMRVILLEQIYRCVKINAKEPYHK